jgi:hypothetical protein
VATAIAAGVAGKLLSLLLALPIYLLFGDAALEGYSGQADEFGTETIFAFVIFAPLFESLIVRFTVWLLGARLRRGVTAVVVLSALVHVPLHGIAAMSLAVFPVFALHALIQWNWMHRGQAWTGYWIVVGAHAITNALSMTAFAIPT